MPRLSDTMEEGTIAAWHKAVGDMVKAGEAFADIETDKAVQTFESFDEGVLLSLLAQVGDTLPLGAPIAILGKKGEDVGAAEAEAKKKLAEIAGGGGGGETKKAEAAEPEP
ncbi:MAG: pyruvate dehydrogenase complex dihydrolipoamide acetyltransferase, partial [Myxococcales bacterium]|nr:pyruvate dehydrogenase complex dihydrolipoamide acetyltransferase [Myxococcales bacterium]